MTDQNSQFFAMLTAVGEAKQANADALGIAWKITQMGVGDANGTEPTPDRLQTALLNERRRAPLNQLKVDPSNASIIIAEQVIPEDVGGWWIREIGLYDEADNLVAIANCAPSFKPQLSQGSGRTQVVRMNLIVSSATNVELKIDPSVVLATRKYVDDELAKRDHKNSVRVATTAAIVLSGTQTIDGIALVAGDRVLVKNQAVGAANGIYVVAGGAWARAADADASIEVTPGLVVAVEQGATLADTRWQLVTDGAIALGTTALTFQNVTAGYAPLSSPAFVDNPTAPTPAQFDNDTSLATTEFVQRAAGSLSGHRAVLASGALTAADVGKLIVITGTGGYSLTLPAANSVPQGSALHFFADHGATATDSLLVSGADIINFGLGAFVSSASIGNSDFISLVSNGANAWYAVNRSVGLDRVPAFASTLAVSGSQRLPSGLIRKWGQFQTPATIASEPVSVTFPEAFPNACLNVKACIGVAVFDYDEHPNYRLCRQDISLGMGTTTGFDGQAFMDNYLANTRVIQWEAIGY